MGDLGAVRAGVEELLAIVDVVKASTDDVALLYPDREVEDVIDAWLGLGPTLVVVTRVRRRGVPHPRRDARSLPPTPSTSSTPSGRGLLHGRSAVGAVQPRDARRPGGPRGPRAGLGEDVEPAVERGLATSAVTVGYASAYAPSLDEL